MGRKAIICITLVALAIGGAASCTREKPGPKPRAYEIPTASPTPTLKATATPMPTKRAPTPTPTAKPPTPTPTVEAATPTPAPTPAPMLTPTAIPAAGFPYTVRWGDTLFSIAQRFGTTVEAIARLNNISDPDTLFAGQQLTIPGAAPQGAIEHVVQRGETLFSIALRYGTTVEAIASANRIFNPDLIFIGQRLTIPGGMAPSGRIHIVRRGENLTSIALRYGTTPQAIAVANNLSNPDLVYVGQRLRIP